MAANFGRVPDYTIVLATSAPKNLSEIAMFSGFLAGIYYT